MADRRKGRKQESGGWGWLLLTALLLTLLLWKTEPGMALREDASAFFDRLKGGQALETLGRSVVSRAGDAAQVFGRQVLGIGE